MLAVGAGADDLQSTLAQFAGLEVAAINSQRSTTVAGPKSALQRLAEHLKLHGVFNRWVGVEVPYHSSHMDPLQDEFMASLSWLKPSPPQQPLYSTVFGDQATEGVFDAAYFWKNARQPVKLRNALIAAIASGFNLFLEVGPHPVLANSIQDVLAQERRPGETLFCQRRDAPDELTLLRAVASVHASGLPIDWTSVVPTRDPIDVPHYAFVRRRHWAESSAAADRRLGRPSQPPLIERANDGPHPQFWIDLGSPRFEFVLDHVVTGHVVLPAAFYIAMALEFVTQGASTTGTVRLEGIEFERALIIVPDTPGTLLMDVDCDQRHIRFYHRRTNGEWQRHSVMRYRIDSEETSAHYTPLSRLQVEHATLIDAVHAYHTHARHGLKYGPAFRLLDALWLNLSDDGESALARLGTAPQANDNYTLHPAVLDAAFQATLSILDDSDDAVVPVRIDQLTFRLGASAPAWVHARLNESNAEEVNANVTLLDESGSVFCQVFGLSCRALESRSVTHKAQTSGCLLRQSWLLPAQATGASVWLPS
jgi:acyl transferase domain-containing protein